ncbi:hypothetical protein EV121DRAFT_218245, partial [Schizophyllum commune]
QVQLVVVDIFRLKTPLVRAIDTAVEVVKWFNNHSLPLGLLRKEQHRRTGTVLALILPGATRWTSHFLCVSRLRQVEESLRGLLIEHGKFEALIKAAGKKREAKAKARELLKTVLKQGFWDRLK